MKYFLLTGCLLLFIIPTNAQAGERPTEGPAFYFNSFSDCQEKNADSALYFADKLAANHISQGDEKICIPLK